MTPPTGDGRATVTVELRVTEGAGETRSVRRPIDLAGPEDVRSLDPRAVRRTWPRAEVVDAEPNLLPLVEFTDCDLPWRFTPEAVATPTPGGGVPSGQLRPWMCLLALEESEFTLTPSSDHQPFTKLDIGPEVVLPHAAESWAWAHVQHFGDTAPSVTDVAAELRDHPERFVARILCPRRLKPRTIYHGFVVPVFRRGALAGLGQAIPPGTAPTALAWEETRTGTLSLPVYFQWRFGTGTTGDFEDLVRRLRARPLPPHVGTRPMRVDVPEFGDAGALPEPVLLQSALQPVGGAGGQWKGEEAITFAVALRDLLDRPALERERPLPSGDRRQPLVPPTYGQWHALRERLGPLPAVPFHRMGWLKELNLDPRHRVAAGMGTRVVQKLQQPLMASAWAQLGDVQRVNETLRFAQLSRESSCALHSRWLVPLAACPEAVVLFTNSVHAQVYLASSTVYGALRRSPVDPGMLDPAWRRLTRRAGALGRRQGRAFDRRPVSLMARMNTGAVRPVQATHTPSGAASPATLFGLRGKSSPLTLLGMLTLLPTENLSRLGGGAAWDELREAAKARALDEHPDLLPRLLDDLPTPTQGFGEALRELLEVLGATPRRGEELVPVDLEALAETLVERLDPAETIPYAVLGRLRLSPRLRRPSDDPLAPVMAAPEFDQPMYAPLREFSQDWILPGLDAVPVDTVTTVKTNRRFVEAYMVGLNHEMARELQWNVYPTDARGSYFRQFWDPAGAVDASGRLTAPELSKDIRPMDTWAHDTALGTHPPGEDAPPERVVLLVRSEVLRRYPDTVIYAVEGVTGQGPRLGDARVRPRFTGSMRPDVTFVGFDLSPEMLRGTRYDSNGTTRSWFFVFEEHLVEFRFGMDETATTACPAAPNDLAWTHLGVEPGGVVRVRGDGRPRALESLLRDDLHVVALGSEKIAKVLFQQRVRVAIPASCMLPG
jgi:hypothetical protein